MRKILLTFTIFSAILLYGCGNLSEMKEAIYGINTQAEKAKNAMTIDAHTIRGIEIEYNNEKFSVNDLFKTILRDVQWEYEKNEDFHQLIVQGTWKEPLFEEYVEEEMKDKLKEKGKVVVYLQVENEEINEALTTVTMSFDNECIVDLQGEKALFQLYDCFLHHQQSN